jgi:hypothetical protein
MLRLVDPASDISAGRGWDQLQHPLEQLLGHSGAWTCLPRSRRRAAAAHHASSLPACASIGVTDQHIDQLVPLLAGFSSHRVRLRIGIAGLNLQHLLQVRHRHRPTAACPVQLGQLAQHRTLSFSRHDASDAEHF